MAAIWRAPFRPFFLLAAVYGPVALVMVPIMVHLLGGDPATADWFGSWSSSPEVLPGWHLHELVFGFTSAILCGFVLTALPSWAGIAEISGWRLAALSGLWLAARAGYLFPIPGTGTITMLIDLAFFPAMITVILPGLLKAPNRRYLFIVPILLLLFLSNAALYAQARGDMQAASIINARTPLYILMILFNAVAGFLTPVFTETALRERGWKGTITFVALLEWAAIGCVVAFVLSSVLVPQSTLAVSFAVFAAVANAARMARWHSWQVSDEPIVAAMHVAFVWFNIALLVHAVAGAGWLAGGEVLALHIFTVGALGTMKLALMVRIAHRHTGRRPQAGAVFAILALLMSIAAILRVVGEVLAIPLLLQLSAFSWAAPFVGYLLLYGRFLIKPSLPREPRDNGVR